MSAYATSPSVKTHWSDQGQFPVKASCRLFSLPTYTHITYFMYIFFRSSQCFTSQRMSTYALFYLFAHASVVKWSIKNWHECFDMVHFITKFQGDCPSYGNRNNTAFGTSTHYNNHSSKKRASRKYQMACHWTITMKSTTRRLVVLKKC